MFQAILLGLAVALLLKNKEDNGDNPIVNTVNADPELSNGENLEKSGFITIKTNESGQFSYYNFNASLKLDKQK